MLPAKLFAALAVIFAILAGFTRLTPSPFHAALDVPMRSTYFVLGPELVFLFCLLTSANFAVLYYAGERIFHARWNRKLTLLHICLFLCCSVSLSTVFIAATLPANMGEAGKSMHWIVALAPLGILSLVASLVVFGINLILTVVQIVRARFGSH